MLDIYSLFYFGAILFGLLGADSYFQANTIRIEATVHPAAVSSGYADNIVENYFDHELQRRFDTNSAMKIPHIRIQPKATLVGTVAKAVGLNDMQAAIQNFLALDPMLIRLVVYPPMPPRNHVVLQTFGSRPSGESFEVSVDAVTGDPAASLRRMVDAVAIAIDPYHASLFEFRSLMRELHLDKLKPGEIQILPEEHQERLKNFEHTLLERLQRITNISKSIFRAPLFNLIGVTRWRLGDRSGAEAAFRQSFQINEELVTPRINLVWMLLQRGDTAAAIAVVETAVLRLKNKVGNDGALQTLILALRATVAYAEQRVGRLTEARHAWDSICGTGMKNDVFIALYVDTKTTHMQSVERCEKRGRNFQRTDDLKEEVALLSTELLLFAPMVKAR